jgi:hypothetical protein
MSATTTIYKNDQQVYFIDGADTAIEFLKLTDDELETTKGVQEIMIFNDLFIKDDRLNNALQHYSKDDVMEVVIDY